MKVHEFNDSLNAKEHISSLGNFFSSMEENGLCIRNITAEAQDGSLKKVFNRDIEISILLRRLLSHYKPSTVLLGHTGVGKTTLIEGLASHALQSNNPTLNRLIFIEIYVGSFIAGSIYRGEMEKRVVSLIKSMKENPNVVLFIDEAHTLFMTGNVNGGGIDIPNLLKQSLSNDRAKFILASTVAESSVFFTDEAFKRRFRLLKLDPLPFDKKKVILKYHAELFSSQTGVDVSNELLDILSVAYLEDNIGLDTCLDILDETFSLSVLENQKSVTENALNQVIRDYHQYRIEA